MFDDEDDEEVPPMRYLEAYDRNGILRGRWPAGEPIPPGLIIGKGWIIKIAG